VPRATPVVRGDQIGCLLAPYVRTKSRDATGNFAARSGAAAGEDVAAEDEEAGGSGEGGGGEIDGLFGEQAGGGLDQVQAPYREAGAQVGGARRARGLPVFSPGGAALSGEGVAGVEFGAQQGGGDGDDRVGGGPGHGEGQQRYGEAGEDSDAAAEDDEAEEGGEGAGAGRSRRLGLG
jgi:hypothetical protein